MYQIVLCSCPNDDVANTIAQQLVNEKLAACVNLLPGITSVYAWQGKIEKDTETLLVIKTENCLFDKLSKRILSLHPYEVPEIVALDIQQGNKAYLDWITSSLK